MASALLAFAQGGGFDETFDDPAMPGWERSPQASVRDGVLQIEPGGRAAHPGEWKNFNLHVRVRIRGEGGLVIGFRASQGSAYLLLVRPNNLALQREAGGRVQDLASKDVDLPPPGEWFDLVVQARGGNLSVALFDSEVLSFKDPDPLPPGGISFETLGGLSAGIDQLSLAPGQADPQPQKTSVPPGKNRPAYQSLPWAATGGPPGGLGYDIRMDPRDPDVMYVTDAWAGAFKSLDGGATWFPINNGITARVGPSGDGIPVFSLTVDPNRPDTLWAGTQFSGGVFRSDDAGASWRAMSTGIQESSLTIRGFTVQPGDSDVVYLAGEISSWEWNGEPLPGLGLDMTKGAVYKTTNRGETWQRVWQGDNLARYVWIHPDDPDRLYVSTGIFDREAANSDPVAIDPGGVGILRSRDGGQTWDALGPANGIRPDELYFGSLFMHTQDPDILLAAAGNDPYMTALQKELGAIYRSDDGGDSWDRVLPLTNASTVEMCQSDPEVAYAGSINGIHRSMDGGRTWQQVSPAMWGAPDLLAGFPIDMQCDPRDSMRIFINNYLGGNFLSLDGGQTWAVSSQGYTGALMSQVAVDVDDSAHVYSAGRMGIFTSLDGGDTWEGTSYGAARAPEGLAVAVDPFDGEHLIITLIDAGPNPIVSRDSGRTWKPVDTGLWPPGVPPDGQMLARIAFSPDEPGLVLAAVSWPECLKRLGECASHGGRGVIRSEDGGETWETTGLSQGQVLELVFASPASTSIYAAVFPDKIYRSEDDGRSWQLVSENLSGRIVPAGSDHQVALTALAVDPQDADTLYAGFYNGGLLLSRDGGQSWQISAAGMSPETSILDLKVDPAQPGLVYAASLDSGVLVSQDGGASWTTINDGLRTRAAKDLALSSDGQVLYLATEGGGVFRLGTPPEGKGKDKPKPEKPGQPEKPKAEKEPKTPGLCPFSLLLPVGVGAAAGWSTLRRRKR